MKVTHLIALPVGVVVAQYSSNTSVTANSTTSSSASSSVRVSTVTYTSCSSSGGETTTGTKTVTEPCGECESMSATPTPELRTGSYHYTTWTTQYTMLCPEASNAEYRSVYTATVTESCTGATPTFSSGPKYVPQGWTSAAVTCTACGSAPTSTVATFPAWAPLPSGVQGPAPAPAPTAPAAPASAPWAPWSSTGGAPAPASAPAGSPSEARESPAGGAPESAAPWVASSTPWASSPAPWAASSAPWASSSAPWGASPAPSSKKPSSAGRVAATTVCAGGEMNGVCETPVASTVEMTEKPASTEGRTGAGSWTTPESGPGYAGNGTHAWYKGAGVVYGPVIEMMMALLAVAVGAGLL